MSLIKKADPLLYDRGDTDSWIDFMNQLVINVKDIAYGALGNDTGNDAVAIQAAVNAVPIQGAIVYLPPGTYRITTTIIFPTDRQVRLVGAGRGATFLHIPSSTTASPGIIHLRGTEMRSSVEHLSMQFDQPDTALRASITHYVPAIYAQGIARFRVQHVAIVRAWFGIDMRQNSNAEINDLEISHFETGIWIDGSLDSIRISHLHDWPFGLTTNQLTVAFEGANTGLRVGRADGLHITDSLFLCGTGITSFPSIVSPGGLPGINITNTAFDSFGGLLITAGELRMSNCTLGALTPGSYRCLAIAMAPSNVLRVQVTNCTFVTGGALNGPPIDISGTGALTMTVTGCIFNTAYGDYSSIAVIPTGAGIANLIVSNSHFSRTSNTTYAAPTIALGQQARGTVVNNATVDKGTGVGTFLTAALDNNHVIANNSLLGWGLILPAGNQVMSVHHNLGAAAGVQYGRGGEADIGARVYRTTNQSVASSTLGKISFDAERFDVPGWHAPGQPTRLTAGSSGWYQIGGGLAIEANTSGARYGIILLNGTTEIGTSGGPVGVSAETVLLTPNCLHYLAAGDYVELCLYQTSAGALNVLASPNRSPEMWMARVAP